MPSNYGFQNESLIAEALNNKKYEEINPNLQMLIRDMFGYQEEKAIIQSGVVDGPFKPDIFVRYKGMTRFISVKCGGATQVHEENIKPFILFLREQGVSRKTQKTILLYHFGDGTLDGSGKRRMDYFQTRMWLENELKEANQELNKNYKLINAFLERTLFQGINPDADGVDYIYFGTPEYGKIVSKRQIFKYVKIKTWLFMDTLHIGPILIKPHARYADKEILNQKYREEVFCYWPNLSDNLDFISKRFNL